MTDLARMGTDDGTDDRQARMIGTDDPEVSDSIEISQATAEQWDTWHCAESASSGGESLTI